MSTKSHRHRSARLSRHLSRRAASRKPYDKVLIVTEGSKTEPHYFEEIRNHYEIHSANIMIDGKSGSSPINVVSYGEVLYAQEVVAGDPFDRVYFVFDKNTHQSYSQAISKANGLSPKNTFFVSNSVPCFEYWLLLHHEYTTKPYRKTGGQSSSDAVIRDLKKYMPNYAKGNRDVFETLFVLLEDAKKNAIRALAAAESADTDNPSTWVHELVDYLQKIKSPL